MPAAAAHVAWEHRSRGTEQRPKVSLHLLNMQSVLLTTCCCGQLEVERDSSSSAGGCTDEVWRGNARYNNKPPPGLQLYSPRPEAGAGVRGAGVAPAQPGLPAVVTP